MTMITNIIWKKNEKCNDLEEFKADFKRNIMASNPLLAFINKYGILTNQWTWLYEALLEGSMTKIALWICICTDDWADKSAIKASNEHDGIVSPFQLICHDRSNENECLLTFTNF